MSNEMVPRDEGEPIDVPRRAVVQRVSRAIVEEPPEVQVSFRQIWLIIRKRKWFLVAATCGCFVLAAMFTLLSTKKYQSTATIEFNKENSDALELTNGALNMTSW